MDIENELHSNIDNKDIKKEVKKNIVLLLMGKLVSVLGSQIYSFAISLYILSITGSGFSFALALALSTLPEVLFGPISGVIADRFDRKKMVVIIDVLSGLVVLGLLVLSLVDQLKISYIYITTFLLSTCSVFFKTPLMASLPNIVDDKNLTRINSLTQTIESISSIAGPFIGGIVYAIIDIKTFLFINGISFIISGISEIFIDFELNNDIEIIDKDDDKIEKKSFFIDFKEGIKYISNQKWLIILTSFFVMLNMLVMMGILVPVPYIVREMWGFTSQQYGYLNTMFPVGILIGSILLAFLPQKEKNYKRLIFCTLSFSIAIFLVGIVTSEMFFSLNNMQYLIILMMLYFIIAIAAIFINVPLEVTVQRLIQDEKRGRVEGTLGSLSSALSPIGIILAGILVDIINPWILPIASGIIMLFLSILMSNVKIIKEI